MADEKIIKMYYCICNGSKRENDKNRQIQKESKEMSLVKWLAGWYKNNCNDNCEHCYGVKITTVDNPGWSIKIDLTGTGFEQKTFETVYLDRSDNNWIRCLVNDNIFKGFGGPENLEEILEIFKEWVTDLSKEEEIQSSCSRYEF